MEYSNTSLIEQENMTPEQFIQELEMVFDRRLKPEARPVYVGRLRLFPNEQLVEILNKVLDDVKFFPRIAEIMAAAKALGCTLQADPLVVKLHRWTPTECPLCGGEGRLLVIWAVAEDESQPLCILSHIVAYSALLPFELKPYEFRSIFRCSCPAGDVGTIPKRWPRWSSAMNPIIGR
jgi:hypothetical protein